MNHRFGRRAHTLPSQLSQNNNYNGHKRANQRSLGPICFLTQEYFKIIVWNFHYIMSGPIHTTHQNQDSGHSPDQSFFFQKSKSWHREKDVLSMETPRMFRSWVQESTFEQTFGKSWKAPRRMSWDTVHKNSLKCDNWVVVSNIFYFHPYLGKIPILTNIFQGGWNHQPDNFCCQLVLSLDFGTINSIGWVSHCSTFQEDWDHFCDPTFPCL